MIDGSKVQILRSQRKTIALQITPDLHVIVRAPQTVQEDRIRYFLEEKSDWIEKHLLLMRQRTELTRQREVLPKYTEEELNAWTKKAYAVLAERTAHFAPLIGVTYNKITIRHQRSRWGSCSAKGNLNYNCLLMQCPPEVIDYVVVHELCHRKEMNHSPMFWNLVADVLPDYESRKKWLKDNGAFLIERLQ